MEQAGSSSSSRKPGRVGKAPIQCQSCLNLQQLAGHHLGSHGIPHALAVLGEISARLRILNEEAIVLGAVVRSAVESMSRAHRTPAQNKALSAAYTTVVRNHLGLFSLIYNEEAQMIHRLLVEVADEQELQEPQVHHTPPDSPPPPPAKRTRVDEKSLERFLGNFEIGSFTIRIMNGKMKGQAFITFQNQVQATQGLEALNGVFIDGKPIIAQFGKVQEFS
ncbi:unnamed protein product [Ceutorhynchus assimilis]|uniref:RRM domain-containing protein n=1 Tax=Ceutorhynchus assimilis TaxID=467358 RepID=A0A9N9QN32_9CUCU|nr:unnamed protein product [Ceutorhynchus assimilis]